ncbi:hypothetical protein EYF80_002956 [Liparis tanakae]|uniref:Uncharacterized protein n=1 Tax=Liparis tanakae TaxID=230148 RepID=A0A4Z2JAK6_9TELE|nr:hypothetical protein EYF80_002956 [Liparis tanakae]
MGEREEGGRGAGRGREGRREGVTTVTVGCMSSSIRTHGDRVMEEADVSIVDRMRTTSALCVGDMCWVMCTIESMATSGLA